MEERPLGVSILSVLNVIGGVILMFMPLLFLSKLGAVSQGMEQVGISPLLAILSLILLAGTSLVSGIGMWMGTRWGWWASIFYYVMGAARNINALTSIRMLAEEFSESPDEAGKYYIKFTGKLIVSLLLLAYFFKSNVVEYFGVADVRKLKSLGLVIGIVVALFIVATAINWLGTS